MNFVGKWVFHSIVVANENDELVRMSAEEYLNSPMPYIDETDEDEVANEITERKTLIGTQIRVCEDGKMHVLAPLPEGVTQEQVDEAVAAGEIKLMDGMMTDKPFNWEERDGYFWYDTETEGELFGEAADTWYKASNDEGFIDIITTRYVKAE